MHYALLRYKPHQDFGNNVDLYTFFSPPAHIPSCLFSRHPKRLQPWCYAATGCKRKESHMQWSTDIRQMKAAMR